MTEEREKPYAHEAEDRKEGDPPTHATNPNGDADDGENSETLTNPHTGEPNKGAGI